ncbi:MAG: alpha-mannosidase [Gemmatimonadales bacterium]
MKKVYIVSHTHWDREWYLTFHRFRVHLTKIMAETLDLLETDPEFRHFVLDGQAIALRDHLQIEPRDEERIRALVEAGKLSIGPWYVLPDEFLVSGEATVRNLSTGRAMCSRFGPAQEVGYMPDSFGHIAQMPQILRGAGIDSFIYTRGNGDEIDRLGLEYRWVAPDGSEVLAVHQWRGYCNAGGLGLADESQVMSGQTPNPDLAVEQVRNLLTEIGERSHTGVALLNNGCDHYPPQQNLGEILDALRGAFPHTEFLHGSFGEYVKSVRDSGATLERHEGELLGGKLQNLLSGVWSSRMYLKQRNDEAQTLLTNYLEPTAAYLHFMHDLPYPSGSADFAWRLLLENHPHDSICGCSIDKVHREMETRLLGVIESAEQELAEGLARLAPAAGPGTDDGGVVLCLMNPLPWSRTEVVERIFVLREPLADNCRLELLDSRGQPIPVATKRVEQLRRTWTADYRTALSGDRQQELLQAHRAELTGRPRAHNGSDDRDTYVTLQFEATLPPLGHAILRLRRGENRQPRLDYPPLSSASDTLENDQVAVRLNPDGSLDVTDKRTGARYSAINRLVDVEDVGDEYDYSPCAASFTVRAEPTGTVRLVGDSGLRATLEAELAMELPARISSDRKSRSKETVSCETIVRISLTRNKPVVDVELEFDNRARDHRLRAEFPTEIEADTLISDGHFYINYRPVRFPDGSDWFQPPSGTYPQQEFSLLQDGSRGIAIFNRGLPEVAPFRTEEGGTGIALTLLRAVGWLSRDDLPTRRFRSAGPLLATPEAQCLRRHRFHYAVVPFSGDYVAADIKGLSSSYRTPFIGVQGTATPGMREDKSLVSKRTSMIAVTAVKRHALRNTLLLRLNNIVGESAEETLGFGRPVAGAWRVNLLEERVEQVAFEQTAVRMALRPHEIATVEIEFD